MADPPRIAVWHRDDLRIRDNPALARAGQEGRPCPLFVFDPQFYTSGMACDARLRFCHEAVDDLADRYAEHGGDLACYHGDPTAILADLDVDRIYVNRSVTGRYGRERDDEVFRRERVTPVADDGIDWTDRARDDYDWQAGAEAYFEADPAQVPGDVLGPNPLDGATDPWSVDERYGIDPDKRDVPTGGASAAWDRLESFAAGIDRYAGNISPPAAAERHTSHLSAYLKFGCLSPRQAYRYVQEQVDPGIAWNLFEERLFWNRHFSQKLADWPAAMDRAINPVFHGLFRERHDPALADAWRRGETGFPLVDASMRALRETGWINFRMRAMCASFFTSVLQCWWTVGADWFYRHLIDADPAINYQQWQMQSGLVGVHPLRIYDPRKQVRDNDPDGEFVYQYVPELRPLPVEHLDRPEKTPLSVQEDCGVEIGEDYPYPVVNFEARRDETRAYFGNLADRAREAVETPMVRRRASLSKRSRDAGDLGEGDGIDSKEQSRLSEF